jgi:hypothetical protein
MSHRIKTFTGDYINYRTPVQTLQVGLSDVFGIDIMVLSIADKLYFTYCLYNFERYVDNFKSSITLTAFILYGQRYLSIVSKTLRSIITQTLKSKFFHFLHLKPQCRLHQLHVTCNWCSNLVIQSSFVDVETCNTSPWNLTVLPDRNRPDIRSGPV